MSGIRWTVLAGAEAVARTACGRISAAATDAIHRRGAFHLVLAGGRTPERAYDLLAETEQAWNRWHLWFGDERCLPPGHPGRNSTTLERILTGRVPIPPGQIHPIPAELGAEAAARAYAEAIAPVLPFDLVLLGLGEDGHTASLFPGQEPDPAALVVPVHHAPKPPSDRVSLNYNTLERCRRLLFLVTGESKQEAVSRWHAGDAIPAARVAPEGESEVLLDRAAVSRAEQGHLAARTSGSR